MSEYWKSTPKYWCKHCGVYVRDTKLERANHEATGRHQGAIKRSLRELHRGHERDEREKERAKREIERLNGVVSGAPPTSASAAGTGRLGTAPKVTAYDATTGGARGAAQTQATQEERHRQLEQLADLGVAIPDELRGDMAMVGEWTVTSTRVVSDGQGEGDPDPDIPIEARVRGVRKRELEKTEEEQEEENAVQSLFKKSRRWGRDTRRMPVEEDEELEALLSGGLLDKVAKKEESVKVKKEQDQADEVRDGDVKAEPETEGSPPVKKEPDGDGAVDTPPEPRPSDVPAIKAKEEDAGSPPAVVFRKRKAKSTRQR